jgi:hypothetical protein
MTLVGATTRTRRHVRPTGREELTAVQPINIRNRRDAQKLHEVLAASRVKGKQAWKHYDEIGEVHHPIRRTARIAGYARFRARRKMEDGTWGDPIEAAQEIADGIYSRYGGTRGLVEKYYTLLKVSADMILVRTKDEQGDYDGYQFLSSDEIEPESVDGLRDTPNRLRWVTLPTGNYNESPHVIEIPAKDVLGRIWQPSARFVDVPDSALAALEVECDQLRTLTLTVTAKLRSRFALAGILFLPNTINTARIAGMNAKTGLPASVMDDIINALTRNISNWEDASTWLPILLMGDPDAAEKIKHITLDREVFETDIKLRAELIDRILFGLDQIASATKGGEEAGNHFAAWEAADQERRIAVAPDLDNCTWAMNRVILHSQMADLSISDEEILRHELVWDLSSAAVRTNQQEDVRQAYDRGEANGEAVRRTAGLDKQDEMSEQERIVWAGVKTNNPYLIIHGSSGGTYATIDWEKVTPSPAKTGPGAQSGGDKVKAGPGVGSPGAPGSGDADGPKRSRPAN